MLFLFRIISDEEQNFHRDLLIDGENTFLEFHQVLLLNLEYDPTQLSSFFITTDDWEKVDEITLIDMGMDDSGEKKVMSETKIGEYFSSEYTRMLYVFDFFSERMFFIELIESFDKKSKKKTPFISAEEGDPPKQMMFVSNDSEEDILSDAFNDIMNGFDDPDLDLSGGDFTDPEIPDDF